MSMVRGRSVKGLDLIGLVKGLRAWRSANGGAEIPGVHPDDHALLTDVRILPSGWYPLVNWLRLLELTAQLIYGGSREGMIEMGRIAARATYGSTYAANVKRGDPTATLQAVIRNIGLHHNFGKFEVTFDGPSHATLTVHDYPEMNEVHGTLYLGWFEVLLELSGATLRDASIKRAPWRGDREYVLDLSWSI